MLPLGIFSLPVVQEAAEAASHAQAAGHYEPLLPGLIILLPFLGFLVNGALALYHARRAAVVIRGGGGNTTWTPADARPPTPSPAGWGPVCFSVPSPWWWPTSSA